MIIKIISNVNNYTQQCITAITADSTTSGSTRNWELCAKPKINAY